MPQGNSLCNVDIKQNFSSRSFKGEEHHLSFQVRTTYMANICSFTAWGRFEKTYKVVSGIKVFYYVINERNFLQYSPLKAKRKLFSFQVIQIILVYVYSYTLGQGKGNPF